MEEYRSMNEDRLVTLILWVVLALGTASLVAAYFVRSERLIVEPHPSSAKQTEAKLPDTIARRTPSSPAPPSRGPGRLLQSPSSGVCHDSGVGTVSERE